jgi:hypothetical protein
MNETNEIYCIIRLLHVIKCFRNRRKICTQCSSGHYFQSLFTQVTNIFVTSRPMDVYNLWLSSSSPCHVVQWNRQQCCHIGLSVTATPWRKDYELKLWYPQIIQIPGIYGTYAFDNNWSVLSTARHHIFVIWDPVPMVTLCLWLYSLI